MRKLATCMLIMPLSATLRKRSHVETEAKFDEDKHEKLKSFLVHNASPAATSLIWFVFCFLWWWEPVKDKVCLKEEEEDFHRAPFNLYDKFKPVTSSQSCRSTAGGRNVPTEKQRHDEELKKNNQGLKPVEQLWTCMNNFVKNNLC